MAIQRAFQTLVLVTVGLFAIVMLARGLVFVAGDNSIVGDFSPEGPRGGCPQTDNCVSSYATEQPWAIDPITCDANGVVQMNVADEVIRSLGDVEVLSTGERYIVRSRLIRFPDDVRIARSSRGIEVLSASRLGAGDLGVNRSRVEKMRQEITTDSRC